MQGIGVSTPKAAAVAAATVGLARDMHIAKGGMLVMGCISWMVAVGGPDAKVFLTGNTTSALGAAPKLHII